MEQKPKLEVKQHKGEGKYSYALFRSDRSAPICSGISKQHAESLKVKIGRLSDIPETVEPIKDWYNFEEIVDVDENGMGVPVEE